MSAKIDRRELVLGLKDKGAKPAYTPAAFFLHFDKSCHVGRPAIDKHAEFFRTTGMDIVKVQMEVPFPNAEVASEADWTKIPRLDSAFFANQKAVIKGLVDLLGGEALVVCTLYSPFMCLGNIAGREQVREQMNRDPKAVRPALQTLSDDLVAFVKDCASVGLDGFYHSTQGGEADRFGTPGVFEEFVKPYDLTVMRECEARLRFNILHVCDYHRAQFGGYASAEPFADYPGHLVSSALDYGGRSLSPSQIGDLYGRPFMGGMERLGPLATGTEDEVRADARRVLAEAPTRFFLGADCTVPADTPWSNLAAAIDEAHRRQ